MPHYWNLSGVYLIYTGAMSNLEEDHRVPLSSYIKGTSTQFVAVIINLDNLADLVFLSFLH